MSKGVLLLSGGLDSSLAGLVLKNMGVDLVALHLESPFGCDRMAETMAGEVGIPLEVRPKGEAFLEVLKKPKYGYGSAMNPCIDCRIHMFNMGKKFMEEVGASFLVTGEVLGQRPMSQKKRSVEVIDHDSGMEGLVLRPLSAKLMAETLPEREGWVDRKRLFGWAGRSRKPQIALARKLGLKTIPAPAGGCLLTDSHFKERIGDFISVDWNGPAVSGEGPASSPAVPVAALLRYGRHFRLDEGEWVIVGRDEADNRALEQHIREAGLAFRPEGFDGPLVCVLTKTADPLPERVMELAYGALHAFGGGKVPEGSLPVKLLAGSETRAVRLPALLPGREHLRKRDTWMRLWRQ
jgi:hypothetical protein